MSLLKRYFLLILAAAAMAAAPDPSAKQPVPPSADIHRATALVNDTFKQELTAAKTAEQKKALVQQFLKAARDEKGANQYVLLMRAKDLAVSAGDLAGTDSALSELDQSFEVDIPAVRFEAYVGLADNIHTAAERRDLSQEVSAKLAADLSSEQLDLARADATLETRVARGGDPAVVEQAHADTQHVRDVESAYGQIKKSLAVLNNNPTDADANLKVGKFRCFVIGNWSAGLLNLSLGDDGALKSIAQAERAGVTTSDAKAALADRWWDIASEMKAAEKTGAELHAADLYRSALADLAGLQKARAEKRIAEAESPQRQHASAGVENKVHRQMDAAGAGNHLHVQCRRFGNLRRIDRQVDGPWLRPC